MGDDWRKCKKSKVLLSRRKKHKGNIAAIATAKLVSKLNKRKKFNIELYYEYYNNRKI